MNHDTNLLCLLLYPAGVRRLGMGLRPGPRSLAWAI